jgi:hypothetical protein
MVVKHGWGLMDTLNVALSLWKKKAITQPRTDSHFLPKNFDAVKHDILALLLNAANTEMFDFLPQDRRQLTQALTQDIRTPDQLKTTIPFMDATAKDGYYYHLIMPTCNTIDMTQLNGQEIILFGEIVSSFCSIFLIAPVKDAA